MEITTLSWKDYRTSANELKSKYKLTPLQIKEKLGLPLWDGVEYHINSDGKGGISRRSRSARSRSQKEANTIRSERLIPKTEGEAANLKLKQSEAKVRSQSTLHQHAYSGKPSIAEHDVRAASGGTNEFMSISDPLFKEFKDNIEARLTKDWVADVDDVDGGVRVIPKKYHNKFQPTSQQPGATFHVGESNVLASIRLQKLAKQLGVPLSQLPAFRANMLGLAPEIVELVDLKTDGAISNAINQAVDTGKQLVSDGIEGWKSILLKTVGNQIMQKKATNYGQY